MQGLDAFLGPNAAYVAEQLERLEREPGSVDPAMRAQLEAWLGGNGVVAAPSAAEPLPGADVAGAAGAAALAQAVRAYGHLGARLDPLGSQPPGDPQLQPEAHGLDEADLERLPASVVGGPTGQRGGTAAEAIRQLRRLYMGTTGFDFAHVAEPAERAWLLEAVESERYWPPHDPVDERGLLDRLTELSAFERFLHRAYPGATRFSIEGLGMMIPMLDEMIVRAGETGVRTVLMGMAHRGRLNVLAHVLGKPYAQVLAEFEGRAATRRVAPSDDSSEGWIGDVKYHAGATRAYETGGVTVVMAPNPSHLEFVNPVVEGMTRAADEDRTQPGPPRQDEVSSLAVLIHGDAAFMGQGVVAETLNLSRLPGYRTGGTLHLIANNQLGFTTDWQQERSTLYASDLARGFEIPVVHVNADDPLACMAAMRLAVAYRGRFCKDVLIDLIGYRRWGHNEGDEPSFTQPKMYAAIAQHPTVRESYAADLVRRGVVAEGEPERLLKAGLDEFQEVREHVLAARNAPAEAPAKRDGATGADPAHLPADAEPKPSQAVAKRPLGTERLRALNQALLRFPDGYTLNPKLVRPVQRRQAAFDDPTAPVDWGHAESLAFGTILQDGVPIRFTGQDALRGTFSHRHATFFDVRTGEPFTPLANLPGARASFDIHNSPLSESAAMGFEYGYSVQAPGTLVLWEAQYGDFVNGAQVIVDEFVVSAQAKWGLRSGLVLLLPHAWEGQGPDHSSGRLERFLELAAEENIRVANCTTAAQYFFLLRRQAASLANGPVPLVVMTPKSLLRHPLATARSRDLAEGAGFQRLIDDERAAANAAKVRRVVLCSGKVWADVEGHARRKEDESVALMRVEELYPLPEQEIRDCLAHYGRARDVVWLQEEPRNMGAWPFMEPRLRALLGKGQSLRYLGRPEMASPAEGWSDVHTETQRRLVQAVFDEER